MLAFTLLAHLAELGAAQFLLDALLLMKPLRTDWMRMVFAKALRGAMPVALAAARSELLSQTHVVRSLDACTHLAHLQQYSSIHREGE